MEGREMKYHRQPRKLFPNALALIVLVGTATGGGLGALTNSINGKVSPDYYRSVLEWEDVLVDIPAAAVGQGIFEGIQIGLVLSTVLALCVGWVSKACCPFGIAVPHLLRIFAGAMLCWCFGGLVGLLLATLSPDFYSLGYHGGNVPDDYKELLHFAWVGGSITGIEWGGAVMTLLECVLFRARWNTVSSPVGPDTGGEADDRPGNPVR